MGFFGPKKWLPGGREYEEFQYYENLDKQKNNNKIKTSENKPKKQKNMGNVSEYNDGLGFENQEVASTETKKVKVITGKNGNKYIDYVIPARCRVDQDTPEEISEKDAKELIQNDLINLAESNDGSEFLANTDFRIE